MQSATTLPRFHPQRLVEAPQRKSQPRDAPVAHQVPTPQPAIENKVTEPLVNAVASSLLMLALIATSAGIAYWIGREVLLQLQSLSVLQIVQQLAGAGA